MSKTYLYMAAFGILITTYFVGVAIGRAKCMEKIAGATTVATQQQLIKKERINAEVFTTGVRDIRDVLRAKYTIAD